MIGTLIRSISSLTTLIRAVMRVVGTVVQVDPYVPVNEQQSRKLGSFISAHNRQHCTALSLACNHAVELLGIVR